MLTLPAGANTVISVPAEALTRRDQPHITQGQQSQAATYARRRRVCDCDSTSADDADSYDEPE